jgi:putative ABC transport system permease protein
MRAILKQAIANVSNRKLQIVLVLITLTAAATLLTLALTAVHSTQGAYQRLFERTKGAHLWLNLNPALTTKGQINRVLADLPGVEATTPIMYTISGTLFLGETRLGGIQLREWPNDPMSVDQHILMEGRKPNPGEKKVIVLYRDTAKAYNTSVGDTINILTPSGRIPLTVIGLYLSSNICPATNCWPPVNYLYADAFHDLGLSTSSTPKTGLYEVGLRLSDPEDLLEVLDEVEEGLSLEAISLWYSWENLQATADGATGQMKTLLLTFSIVAGLAGLLLMSNTISGAIRSQLRQIGLLKTVGFTNPQLRWIYTIESILLSLVSSIFGLILGGFSSTLVLRFIAQIFGEERILPPLWVILVVPCCAVILAMIATLLPARRAERQSAVDAIRFGPERPRGRKMHFISRFTTLMLGLSESFSYPLRSLLTGLGIGMAVFTLTAALILNHTFDALTSDPKLIGFDEDLYVYRTPFISDEEIRHWIETHPEILAYYFERWGKFRFEGEEKVYYARFREGDLSSFTFPMIEGVMFEHDNEAVVGYGHARERGIKVGDEIAITIEGERMNFEVSGIYRENSNNGRMLILPLNALRKVLPDLEVYTYNVKLSPEADPKIIAADLTADTNDLTEVMIPFTGGLSQDLIMAKKVMLGLSVIMSIIASLGILSSLWMSVQERQRLFGMLKAVGMTPREISISVITGALSIALGTVILGVPVSVVGVRVLIDIVAQRVGFGPLQAPVDMLSLAFILPAIALIAILGALIPAGRAARISVVDMLRYE